MLKFDRTIHKPNSLSEILCEDPNEYSWEQMEAILQIIDQEAKVSGEGSVKRTLMAVAMLGCVRFLQGYYLTFVTQRRKHGCIGGNYIYGIQGTQQIAISANCKSSSTWAAINNWLNPSPEDEAEARYLGLFHFLDLTKDFYFSYTYDLTRSLQNIMTCDEETRPLERFSWNYFLTNELEQNLTPVAAKYFIQPMIYGSYEQRKCAVFGRLISVILIARRSRHFAGTRYLKRGVSDSGNVANDVEIEQIVEDESMGEGRFSSFVQYRGSIPIFWTQETSVTIPKPPIVLNRVDPTYAATRKHFADLFERYGSPLIVLNLVKQSEKREREVIVGDEFRKAVLYINNFMPPDHRIRYVALDYSRMSKQKGQNVLQALDEVAIWSLKQTGFFCSAPKRQIGEQGKKVSEIPLESPLVPPPSPTLPRHSKDWFEQQGVLRVNCVDCLDRTNVGQFSVGVRALGQQLYTMGLNNSRTVEGRSQLIQIMMILYSRVGDALALQYGGSEAHKNVKDGPGKEKVKHRELLTSIRRYYSNSFTDMVKQDAINVFLGHFKPDPDEPPLWELESDYYLHNFKVKHGPCGENAIIPNPQMKQIRRRAKADNVKALLEQRRQRRREAFERARKESEWWIERLRNFDEGKCVNTLPNISSVNAKRFLQMYHTKELTYFDKKLDNLFMRPIDLSHDRSGFRRQHSIREFTRKRLANVSSADESTLLPPNVVGRAGAAMSAAGIAPPVSDFGPSSLEDFAASCGIEIENVTSNFIGSCRRQTPLRIYEQYADAERLSSPQVDDDSGQRNWYQTHMLDFYVNADRPDEVRAAQVRAGAIEGSHYHGLAQTDLAREHIDRVVRTDPGALADYENVLDPQKLASLPEATISYKTREMYESFFGPSLHDPAKEDYSTPVLFELESHAPQETAVATKIEEVGVTHLFSNTDREFVMFNDAAADCGFGRGLMKDEVELSYYAK